MLDEIRAKRDEIYAIARRHKAEKLWVFGLLRRSLGVGGCAKYASSDFTISFFRGENNG